MKSGQKGFTVIETLLGLILVSIIGLIGYYVYHTRSSVNSSYNKSSQASATTPVVSNNAKTIDTKAASAMVQEFYDKYYQANGGSNVNATPDPAQIKLLVEQYGTANLVSTYNTPRQYDPMVCGQNVDPISVTGTKSSGPKVIVSVHDSFQGASNDFSVDVINSSGLKIDAVICPNIH